VQQLNYGRTLATLFTFALSNAYASRRLKAGSGPPNLTAAEISFAILVVTMALAASAAPFVFLIFDHLLWPA
jgi:hypothetical protein